MLHDRQRIQEGAWARRSMAAALAAALVAASLPAWAQETSEKAKLVADHDKRAKVFFDQGKFRDAKAELLAEEALSPTPMTELYLGRSCEQLGEDEEALDWYEQALAAGTLPVNLAKTTRERVAALKVKMQGSSALPAAEPGAVLPQERVHSRSLTTMYLTASGAVVFFGLGTYFGLKELHTQKDFNAAPSQELQSRGRTQALLADLTFGLGIALATVCIITYVTDKNDYEGHGIQPPAGKVSVTPWVSPLQGGSGGASFNVVF